MKTVIARTTLTALGLSMAFLLGSAATSALASGTEVLHLRVLTRVSGESIATLQSEYWIDESRRLAKVIDTTPQGATVSSNGPDWKLVVPAEAGPALRFEGLDSNSAAVRAVAYRLYYYRDAARAGAATVTKDATTYLVAISGAFASLDPVTELPLWIQYGGTRLDHVYQLQERLPASQFPSSFFAATDRDTSVTTETNLTDAAARAHFALLSPGASFAGRPNVRTFFTAGANPRVLEQFNQMYGEDVQLSMSLLSAIPTQLRPGGTPVATAIGPGMVYEDSGSTSILVFRANVVVGAFAPDLSTALALLDSLRPIK